MGTYVASAIGHLLVDVVVTKNFVDYSNCQLLASRALKSVGMDITLAQHTGNVLVNVNHL